MYSRPRSGIMYSEHWGGAVVMSSLHFVIWGWWIVFLRWWLFRFSRHHLFCKLQLSFYTLVWPGPAGVRDGRWVQGARYAFSATPSPRLRSSRVASLWSCLTSGIPGGRRIRNRVRLHGSPGSSGKFGMRSVYATTFFCVADSSTGYVNYPRR